jgi:hypothetical protein
MDKVITALQRRYVGRIIRCDTGYGVGNYRIINVVTFQGKYIFILEREITFRKFPTLLNLFYQLECYFAIDYKDVKIRFLDNLFGDLSF